VATAAYVAANLDALNANAQVGSITLTDAGTPALTLTVHQALSDTMALSEITGLYTVTISDTAANVVANLNALNADAQVSSITLTDPGTPTLSLTVQQAVNDKQTLKEITTPYTIQVLDTAANIETLTTSQISGLAAHHATQIVASDTNVMLTAAQAVALEKAHILVSAPSGHDVTLSDTAAHLQSLTTTQISGLSAIGVAGLYSNNANVTYSAAQTSALLAGNESVAVSGTHIITETFTNAATVAYASNGSGGGTLALGGNGLTVTSGASSLSVTGGTETLTLTDYAVEAFTATGKSNETFVFIPSFGQDTITGFAATGTTHDILQFSATAFGDTSANTQAQDLAAMLAHTTQNAAGNAVITDISGDSVTLAGISKATLSAAGNAGDFVFK
jgi:hypothetical protein